MPEPTPFAPRTRELCTSLFYKEWAGYHAVRSYDTVIDPEYFALRHSAGLIDVSPLFKLDVRGPDAADFLSYVSVRDVRRLREGRVAYTCFADEEGKAVDDGTISRLGESRFRVTSAEPSYAWLSRFTRGFDVTVEDETARVAALSLQGPSSREVLARVAPEAAALRFFGVRRTTLDGVPVEVSRTGYTGDLGYEIWVEAEKATSVWDALMEEGRGHLLAPVGLDAMDITRIEAGFILLGVDYLSAPRCLIEDQKSSVFEIGLGWMVDPERSPFVGQAALREEKRRGSRWALVGLDVSWDATERLYEEYGLPPRLPARAWRDPVPVYHEGRQVGRATSGSWSPLLKKNLALATVETGHAHEGDHLDIEVTVEYERRSVPATVVARPFYDPARKRS